MGETEVMVLVPPTADALRLRPPTADDAAVLGGWSASAGETMRWCSSREHPVPAERIVSWWASADIEPYVGIDLADTAVAYGELWLDRDEDEVELARLIVTPARRGQGVGRRLVAALVQRARTAGLAAVILRVSPGNLAAVACYRASGFRELDATRNAEWNHGQSAPYLWMELLR